MRIADIARIAIAMEEKGSRFYYDLADRIGDEKARQIFLKLAEQEKEHRLVFEKMLSTYGGDEILEKGASDYLSAVCKGSVFPDLPDIKKFAAEVRTAKDALSIGIQAEKDGILVYHELLALTKSEKASKIIYNLLEEEKMHLIELRDYYDEL